MNVASLVLDRARREPEAIALRQPAGRHPNGRIRYEAISNRELDQGSDALARGLEALGLRRGTRTAVMVLPGRDLFELMLALFKLGAVPILVDPGIGLGRLRRCLDEARPEAFVGTLKAQIARRLLGWARRTIRLSVTAGVGHRFPGPTLDRLRLQGPAGGRISGSRPLFGSRSDKGTGYVNSGGEGKRPRSWTNVEGWPSPVENRDATEHSCDRSTETGPMRRPHPIHEQRRRVGHGSGSRSARSARSRSSTGSAAHRSH